MVVVDSSALIPLARTGNLSLTTQVFDRVETTEDVYRETVEEGGRGASAIKEFLEEEAAVRENDAEAGAVAEAEGIAGPDASLLLLAEERDETLLTNDRALIQVARARGVETYWVTTLLLRCVKDGHIESEEGKSVLYDLVDAGMNLSGKVYAAVQKRIEEF